MKPSPYKYKETQDIFKQIKVLIVDDDMITTSALEMFLTPHIPNIITFNSPLSAKYYLEHEKVDLLITDYWMNEMTGVDLIKYAKKVNPDICSILLTVEDKLPVAEIVNIGVDRYLKKPAFGNVLLEAIEYAVHRILLNKILLEKSQRELELSKLKEKYHTEHQKEAFRKQLNIIKDELNNSTYLESIDLGNNFYYFKSYYKPRDILSGDCYSIRLIGENRVFLYILDVMGKGLSASVTAINASSMINYLINSYKNSSSFINKVVTHFIDFIKTVILDEEIICSIFAEIDFNNGLMHYVNFSMPPIFVQLGNNIEIIQANELPINKSTDNFSVIKRKISKYDKLMFLSDGIIEAKDKNQKIYFNQLQEDFKNSDNFKEFFTSLRSNLKDIPDDVTLIFAKKIIFDGAFKKAFKIKSRLDDINEFVCSFCERLKKSKIFSGYATSCGVVLTELLMNAHEHGNLALNSKTKDKFIAEGTYYEKYLKEIEKNLEKHITIKVALSISQKKFYMLIEDEGEGFDKIERPEDSYFSSYGLKIVDFLVNDYLNNVKGNQIFVIFDLNKIEDKSIREILPTKQIENYVNQ